MSLPLVNLSPHSGNGGCALGGEVFTRSGRRPDPRKADDKRPALPSLLPYDLWTNHSPLEPLDAETNKQLDAEIQSLDEKENLDRMGWNQSRFQAEERKNSLQNIEREPPTECHTWQTLAIPDLVSRIQWPPITEDPKSSPSTCCPLLPYPGCISHPQ